HHAIKGAFANECALGVLDRSQPLLATRGQEGEAFRRRELWIGQETAGNINRSDSLAADIARLFGCFAVVILKPVIDMAQSEDGPVRLGKGTFRITQPNGQFLNASLEIAVV